MNTMNNRTNKKKNGTQSKQIANLFASAFALRYLCSQIIGTQVSQAQLSQGTREKGYEVTREKACCQAKSYNLYFLPCKLVN